MNKKHANEQYLSVESAFRKVRDYITQTSILMIIRLIIKTMAEQ
ncbi:MAG: hypothetical protein FD170_1991 [Bacteroidetes bacterium]|nr:MAG: hypothetical protein FD170_1991 [Bacteroidota bacterium]